MYGPCPPERHVSQGNSVLQPLYPPPVPVVVETINPTAFSPLSCGSFVYQPRLGHRVRPWTLSSPMRLVVDVKESTTHAANLVVFPYRLPLPSILSRARLPPTFWSSARHMCCCSPPPPQTTSKCVTHRCSINTCFPYTTLSLNPCYAPYTLPLGRTPCPHNKPCHFPIPSPLSFPPPSMTVHGPTWCRGRLRLTGLRALYSPNGMTSISYSACATTQSGLSSTLLQEGCCGTDQSSLPQLPWGRC